MDPLILCYNLGKYFLNDYENMQKLLVVPTSIFC